MEVKKMPITKIPKPRLTLDNSRKIKDILILIKTLKERKEKITISKISKCTNITYCHTHIICLNLNYDNFIIYTKKGRCCEIELTANGLKIIELLEKLKSMVIKK